MLCIDYSGTPFCEIIMNNISNSSRVLKSIIFSVLVIAAVPCLYLAHATEKKMIGNTPKANHLIHEKSPYLLQHAYNPVEWYPWGEAAFTKARQENKPIILSIGYSTCHWCHVMEEESFEDPETAAVMNRYFVSIKVDREERPDIDKVYMAAVSAITGSGGWPLNVFLTPDRKPFFGGTYFPPYSRPGMPGWVDLLQLIGETWNDAAKREKLLSSADDITSAITRYLAPAPESSDLDSGIFNAARQGYASAYDEKMGGFSGAPKFPSPSIQNFLMTDYAIAEHSGNKSSETERSLEMALGTLKAMARGGIYDQLGGGFHRYSTDARWHIPHFEKMLYDNAQLIVNYTQAYRLTGESFFLTIAKETADYVIRDMTHSQGGVFSAEDADSLPPGSSEAQKVEGAFYVWAYSEVQALLGDDRAKIFAYRYGMKPDGNAETDPFGEFKGKNILYVDKASADTARHFNRTMEETMGILAESKQQLFAVRTQRPRPHLDDKVLSSWNGLMISALAKLHQASGDEKYLKGAQKAAIFIKKNLYDEKSRRLYRRWRDGDRKIDGIAADYAFLIQGVIDLYESDFNPQWLKWAVELADEQLAAFYDKTAGGFFMTRDAHDKNLIIRVKEDTDNVLPSAASVTALNLLRLSRFNDREDFSAVAEKTLRAAFPGIRKHPTSAPQMLVALGFSMTKSIQIIIAGPDDSKNTRSMLKIARSAIIPGKTVLLVDGSDTRKMLAKNRPFIENIHMVKAKSTAYVCFENYCKEPVTDPDALKRLLDAGKG